MTPIPTPLNIPGDGWVQLADTESTSARLRRVEQQLSDSATAVLETLTENAVLEAGLASARAELDLVRRQLADEQAARLDAEARLNHTGGTA